MIDYFDINLEHSINSGQVFLWKKENSNWYGINGQDVLKINSHGRIKTYSKNKIDFFRKSDNIEKILNSLSKDKTTKQAIEKYIGLRLIRQDPF